MSDPLFSKLLMCEVMKILRSFHVQKFPGTVETTATYTLDEDNKLTLVMEATTDKATPINLVNHAYFNLNGQANGTILDHVLQIPNGYGTHQTCFVWQCTIRLMKRPVSTARNSRFTASANVGSCALSPTVSTLMRTNVHEKFAQENCIVLQTHDCPKGATDLYSATPT